MLNGCIIHPSMKTNARKIPRFDNRKFIQHCEMVRMEMYEAVSSSVSRRHTAKFHKNMRQLGCSWKLTYLWCISPTHLKFFTWSSAIKNILEYITQNILHILDKKHFIIQFLFNTNLQYLPTFISYLNKAELQLLINLHANKSYFLCNLFWYSNMARKWELADKIEVVIPT